MSFVLGLIILVAACTVIATIIMVVLEKKKEIAAPQGHRREKRRRSSASSSTRAASSASWGRRSASSSAGSCCRFLLVYSFPLDPKVYFISRLPVSMRPVEFLLPAVVAIGICLVATIFPAMYAAQLRPADGLRAE